MIKKLNDKNEALYGFADEDIVIGAMKASTQNIITNYTEQGEGAKSNNPLAALFGSLKKERNRSETLPNPDKDVLKDIKNRKIKATSQLKIIMAVKDKFEDEIVRRRIFKKMATGLKNFVV